jgi:acetyl esterase
MKGLSMLDLQFARIVAQAQAAGLPDFSELPPQAARGLYREILAAADVPAADVAVSDRRLPRPAPEAGTLGVRLYRPHCEGALPLVVYYHGGGFAMGDLDGYDRVCRRLCEDTQAMVMSVDYRLAPEHPFPAAVDDAWAALQWAAEHAASLGADPARIAVAGDSAGGTLAAVVSLLARDAGGPRLACQALVYPCTASAAGLDGPYPSREQYAEGPTLTLRTMEYFNRLYLAPGTPLDFRVAPMLASDLSRLPPALVLVAAHDPLRDEILAYCRRLLEAGTDTTVIEYHGLAHGFISMAGAVRGARLAQLQLASGLRAAFEATP